MNEFKAFETVLIGVRSIVFAKTAGSAKALTYQSAKEAGYRTARFVDCRARRRPDLDHLANDRRPICYDPSVVEGRVVGVDG